MWWMMPEASVEKRYRYYECARKVAIELEP